MSKESILHLTVDFSHPPNDHDARAGITASRDEQRKNYLSVSVCETI